MSGFFSRKRAHTQSKSDYYYGDDIDDIIGDEEAPNDRARKKAGSSAPMPSAEDLVDQIVEDEVDLAQDRAALCAQGYIESGSESVRRYTFSSRI